MSLWSYLRKTLDPHLRNSPLQRLALEATGTVVAAWALHVLFPDQIAALDPSQKTFKELHPPSRRTTTMDTGYSGWHGSGGDGDYDGSGYDERR